MLIIKAIMSVRTANFWKEKKEKIFFFFFKKIEWNSYIYIERSNDRTEVSFKWNLFFSYVQVGAHVICLHQWRCEGSILDRHLSSAAAVSPRVRGPSLLGAARWQHVSPPGTPPYHPLQELPC